MFVCKENVAFSSYDLRTVITKLFVTKTQKGYATECSMLEWIRNVISPYVQRVARTLRREESMIYLIIDNCRVHNTPAVKAEFRKVSRLRVVSMPPHTSHFYKCSTLPCSASSRVRFKTYGRSIQGQKLNERYYVRFTRCGTLHFLEMFSPASNKQDSSPACSRMSPLPFISMNSAFWN